MIAALLPSLLPLLGSVLDKVLPDPAARAKAEAEISRALLENAHQLDRAASQIVLAEAKSDHWLTAAWRPVLMLTVTGIIANNYILAPYVALLAGVDVALDLPERLWDLLTIGVGGYVVGRSAEKAVANWKGN